ncbi:MAG: hypothetical protein ABIG30_03755 [Candidatus Aenigmatarchaeota archaeon]
MIDDLILKISDKMGKTEKEVRVLIKIKQDEMGGLLSEDGAAYLVAKEAGIIDDTKTVIPVPEEKTHVKKERKRSIAVKKSYDRKTISELHDGDYAELSAAILQIFDMHPFFYSCPKCGKAVKEKCITHKDEEPQIALKLNGVIDDGSASMRIVMFRQAAENILGMGSEDAKTVFDLEGMKGIMNSIELGKEFIFRGHIKLNNFFGNNEFVVNSVKNVNVLEEIERLDRVLYGGQNP